MDSHYVAKAENLKDFCDYYGDAHNTHNIMERIVNLASNREIKDVDIKLPDGFIKFTEPTLIRYPHVRIETYPDEAAMDVFCSEFPEFIYDRISRDEQIHVNPARVHMDADGEPYTIRIDSEYGKSKFSVEIPHVKPSETANGYTFYESPGFDPLGIGKKRMAHRYESAKKILADVSKFEVFENVSETSPNSRSTQVCIVPQLLDVEKSASFIRALIERGTLEYGFQFKPCTNFIGLSYSLSATGEDKPRIACNIRYSDKYWRDSAVIQSEKSIQMFGIRLDDATPISYMRQKYPGKERSAISRFAGIIASRLIGAAFDVVEYPYEAVCRAVENGVSEEMAQKHREAIRKQVVSEKLKESGLPMNKDFGSSCFTVVGDDLQKEIDEETAKRIAEYEKNRSQ